MTFSIVALDGTSLGVAVASKFLAVGSVVPGTRLAGSRVPGEEPTERLLGAVATQASARVSYKNDVLRLLQSGRDSAAAIAEVTAADEGREHRQLGVVGVDSQATYTGSECLPWAGGRTGSDDSGRYAIQGNILTGEEVVEEMERAWLASAGEPFTRRLLAALLAGDAAGGDSRGRQSAAIQVLQPGAGYDAGGVLADLRVDDHPQAPQELARLLDLHDIYFGKPQDLHPLTGDLAPEVTRRLATLGHTGVDVDAALESWSSVENYEMLRVPGSIDGRVLEALRAATVDQH